MKAQAAAPPTPFGDAVRISGETVTVADEKALGTSAMDALVRDAVFGGTVERERARWLIWEIGQAVGVRPASIHDLYRARGRGETKGFTVPAINVRGTAYDTARAIFRTASQHDAGAFILEIARSEIAYTDQRPAEYVSVMLAAALREGYPRPGVHPGRSLPGERQEVRRRSRWRSGSGEAARRGSGDRRLLQHRRGYVHARELSNCPRSTSSSGSTTRRRRRSRRTCADSSRRGSRSPSAARSAKWARRTAPWPKLEAFMDGYDRTMKARGDGAWRRSRRSRCRPARRTAGSSFPTGRSRM